MKFLLRLDTNCQRYSELISSGKTDPQHISLYNEKLNVLRFISIFMTEDFVNHSPTQHQLCFKSFIAFNRNYKAIAIYLNIPEKTFSEILSEIEAKMIVFVGVRTINNINQANTIAGIQSAMSHFRQNMERLSVQD